jgi:hypothetical protein
MWISHDELERIADIAQTNDKLLSMLVEWNDTKDWGLQDQILCKIVSYVKELDNTTDSTNGPTEDVVKP